MLLQGKMKNVNVNKPNHVAIIMDGNGRWAKLKGKSSLWSQKWNQICPKNCGICYKN